MFTIIISEKGGAERRETFDKNEINVGRVQGNDLMLPKGNVSKHHARLLFRDGRFIVTDLKSTNGTYVNGRKIAQATIVREGDKIYIGDFILRVDVGGAAGVAEEPGTATPDGAPPHQPQPSAYGPPPNPQGPPPMPQPPMPGSPNMAPMATSAPGPMPFGPPPPAMPPMPAPMPPAPMAQAAAMPPQQPQLPQQPVPAPAILQQQQQLPQPLPPVGPPRPSFPAAMSPLPTQAPGPLKPDPGAVSHFPLERDPDDSEANAGAAPGQRMPAPPRVPHMPNKGGTLAISGTPGASPTRPPSLPPPGPVPSASGPVISPARTSQPGSTPSRVPPRESPAQAGRRLALSTLVDRVYDVVDLSAIDKSPVVTKELAAKIEAAVVEQLAAMKNEEGIPEGADAETLRTDAIRELTGLGALGLLLEDDDVHEVHCLRHDQVLAVRSSGVSLADASFSSDGALRRAILRLADASGGLPAAGESILDRRTPKGAHMMAFLPPVSLAHALVVRKRRRVEMSIEDFVRLSAMSRAMATFLEACIAARSNILVCASSSGAATTFLSALASGGGPGDRIAVLQDEEDFSISHGQVLRTSVAADGISAEALVRATARIRPERLIVGALTGPFVAATLEAIAEGTEGVLAAASAPSLRHALSRLTGQPLLARPGIGAEAARELVGEAFDVAIEVHLLPDGRYRVARIAELGGADAKGIISRDIFIASAEGGADAHVATGVVPRIVNEFGIRGVRIDPNLFKKTR
ncbi:hypothetical protein BH09MYX1_BH09MYX1_20730 [soil metagenome]